MGILIEINTDNAEPGELRAVSNFLSTLADLHGGVSTIAVATAVPAPVAQIAPPPPANPAAAAESLMAAETARVAAANPPPVATGAPGGPLGVDAEGLPWDARIHSSNQKRTAKDVWVAKRNLDAATNAQVRSELFAALGAPPAIPVGQAPPPPAAVAQAAPPPPVVAAAPVPAPTPAPAPAADVSGATFADLMMRVVDLQTAAILAPEEVTAKCVALGLSQIRDFAVRSDLIPAMMASLPVPPVAG